MITIYLFLGLMLIFILVIVAINQFIIIKDDKQFSKEMDRRMSHADKKIDIELYKRIQKKVGNENE